MKEHEDTQETNKEEDTVYNFLIKKKIVFWAQDLSSLTRDQTRALCSASLKP